MFILSRSSQEWKVGFHPFSQHNHPQDAGGSECAQDVGEVEDHVTLYGA